jgi:heptosyltransferase II
VKILLVQTAFIGDIILSAPLVARLGAIHPGAELWLLTTGGGAELFRADPRLAGIITFDKRGRERGVLGTLRKARELRSHGFDLVYSLHRSARTAILLYLAGIPRRIGFDDAKGAFLYTERRARRGAHEVQRKLSLVGEEAEPGKPGLLTLHPPPLEQCAEEVRDWLADERPYAVLAPGSAWETKQWSAEGFRETGAALAERGFRIAVVGAPNELAQAGRVCGEGDPRFTNWAGRTTLGEMLRLVEGASLVVCNDSMVLHLASSFGTPVVAAFCATSPSFGFGPWNANGRVVERTDLACKPCRPHGGRRCPTGTWACSRGLSAEPVLAAAAALVPSPVRKR